MNPVGAYCNTPVHKCMETVTVKIRRRQQPEAPGYWEEFHVPFVSGMTVISVLRAIQKKPVNSKGETSTPVVYDGSCLEEKCGSCIMVINRKPRLSCATRVEELDQPITLEPLSKFPVVRDLSVDRSRMQNDLKKINAWIPVDGNLRLGGAPLRFGPRLSLSHYEAANPLSDCIQCGACLEVCPEYHAQSPFVGAMAISEVRLLNLLPSGEVGREKRLWELMQEGGVDDCGKAENCLKACPKGIPLVESISGVGREVTVQVFKKLFG